MIIVDDVSNPSFRYHVYLVRIEIQRKKRTKTLDTPGIAMMLILSRELAIKKFVSHYWVEELSGLRYPDPSADLLDEIPILVQPENDVEFNYISWGDNNPEADSKIDASPYPYYKYFVEDISVTRTNANQTPELVITMRPFYANYVLRIGGTE